jgi:putative hydrolase of the HAD superfamily
VITAVLFDLDDTLYPQSSWLAGAWEAVASAAPPGFDRTRILAALRRVADEGSDRGAIIDRAMASLSAGTFDIAPLVAAFRSHAPPRLEPYPGAREVVTALRQHVPIGLVSDGDPAIQHAKLAALDLAAEFDVVVLSDELGRDHRKPHPAPFLMALRLLGVTGASSVMLGDRPDKDTRGSRAAGLLGCVRIRTGEYADRVDEEGCLASVGSIVEAGRWVLDRIDRRGQPSAASG